MALLELVALLQTPFAIVGVFIVLRYLLTNIWDLIENIYAFYISEGLGRTVKYKELGEWAVVTGATDGIGKGYAFDLARRGCNIVLMSRNEDRLRNVAKEIEDLYKVRTKTIVVDFGGDESIYDKLREELTKLEIGTLINNVGIVYPYPEHFDQVPGGEEFFLKLIRINCVAQTLLTRIVIPQMVKRKKGVLIHLSSGGGTAPAPMLAVYSATKAYNAFLGKALQQEYKDKGLHAVRRFYGYDQNSAQPLHSRCEDLCKKKLKYCWTLES